MRTLIVVIAAGVCHVLVAAEPPVYRWQRAVVIPPRTETSLVRAALDQHVFSATRDGFIDVRLHRQDGVPASFVLRRAPSTRERTVRRTWVAKQTGVKRLDNGGLQVLLEVGTNDPQPTGLQVITPLRDFELQVRVDASSDGETWLPAGDPGVIFDYSQYIDARHLDVPLQTTHRRVRITIEDVTAEQESQLIELTKRLRGGDETERAERTTIQRRPFRIDRVNFYRDELQLEIQRAKTTSYSASDVRVTEDAEHHRTIVAFASRREPISSVRLLTESENFSRTASVEVQQPKPGGSAEWQVAATDTLTRFAIGSLSKDERELAIPETRAEAYRLIIENRDSPPLSITGVELRGPVYEAAFLASPSDSFDLVYGSPDAEPGRFDTAAIEAALSSGTQSLQARLGDPQENTAAPTEPKWQPWNDPKLLIGAIVALTLVLGWGLVVASRQVQLPHDPSAPSGQDAP